MSTPARVSTFFKARSGAFKAAVGFVGPTTAIVSTLLALGLISPFGSEDAIAKSIEKTKDASTSEVAIGVRIGAPSGGGEAIAYTGEGQFDHETGYGHLVLDFSETAGMENATAVEAILHGQTAYFRRRQGAAGDRPWLRVDLVEVADRLTKLREIGAPGATAVDLSALANVDFPDPSTALDFLEQSSDLKAAGERTLLGRQTRLFTGTLKQDKGTLHLSVWIDDEDLVRQMRITGGPTKLDYTLGFKDFDVKVDATPPAAGNTSDALELIDQRLAGGS